MRKSNRSYVCLTAMLVMLAALVAPAYATVTITLVRHSLPSGQLIGTSVTWTAKATDSNPGPLTFEFDVTPPGKPSYTAKAFNVGTLKAGTWTSQAFVWNPTYCSFVAQPSGVSAYTCNPIAGVYKVQVTIKDFTSGETATKIDSFKVNPLVTGSTPVVAATSNPLVALFSAPACARGSNMQVSFQQQSGATPATTTNQLSCDGTHTMTFEVAGMYPSTTYNMFSQTIRGAQVTNGPTQTFTTGPLPSNIKFGSYNVKVGPGPTTDTTDSLVVFSISTLGNSVHFPDVATDLNGNIMWYYGSSSAHYILRRPLTNGTLLNTEDGPSWNPQAQKAQLLRQIDLAGNIVRETNTGILQQQLLALGAADGGPCSAIEKPPQVGDACLGAFHHDDIQTLPNGDTAVLVDIEKIYPAGTQGNNSGLPVDIIGDMIVVLDTNWNAKWYFDTFEHATGAPQLDINRPAVLGETCGPKTGGCPPMFLLGTGIAPLANDWLHANAIYYWPSDSQTGTVGDLVWSSRHQDWVMKVDYQNGAGTGNILWRLGREGDFTFNNINGDPWPWFSHQHEAGIENGGAGPFTIFDNGNTRISKPPLGLGSACGPNDCHSRGMALDVDEIGMLATPVLSADLGVYSSADGSAQLLSDGNYFFEAPAVFISAKTVDSYAIEIFPTTGTTTGTIVSEIQTASTYRAWRVPSLYAPPIT
jgi:arylsulfate sulfotransferase